jgi:hypothetical protein
MSRGYAVHWVTVRNTVHAADHLEISIELLGIIAEGEMNSLLQRELERDGWKRQSDGTMLFERDGVRASLDQACKKITVTSEKQCDVVAHGVSDQDANQELEGVARQSKEALGRELVLELTKAEADLRAEVDQAIQRVYVEALKKKAASIGTIEGMQESRREDGEYEITIRVRT